jgi:hypothetical protein
VPNPDQRVLQKRQGDMAGKAPAQKFCLVKASLPPSLRMQGNRDDNIKLLPFPALKESARQKRRQQADETLSVSKLQILDDAAQLCGIVAEGSRAGEKRRTQDTIAAEMCLAGFKVLKGQAAGRTPRLLDPELKRLLPARVANTTVLLARHRRRTDEARFREDQIQYCVRNASRERTGKIPDCGNEWLSNQLRLPVADDQ